MNFRIYDVGAYNDGSLAHNLNIMKFMHDQ